MTNQTPQRADYLHFQPVTTRWQDNDVYGHVNNVAYYSFFDTAVHSYLIEHGGLDIHGGEVVGFVVSSACDYFASVSYPELIEVGLRVGKLGSSSVQYELAVFRVGEEEACAAGSFVHVFVDRQSNQPVAIPDRLRGALQGVLVQEVV
jgi:acyl-CoA thioester hydrolase